MELLFPPFVFIISLCFIVGLSAVFSLIETKPKSTTADGAKYKPYGCGEDVSEEKIEPDYYGFFPFAIFFTLLHVSGLMIATWGLNTSASGLALISGYALSVIVILMILFIGD